jgi:hypothetical protein
MSSDSWKKRITPITALLSLFLLPANFYLTASELFQACCLIPSRLLHLGYNIPQSIVIVDGRSHLQTVRISN